MGAFNFTVGELTSQIKKMGSLNIAHLGNGDSQDIYIWYYITLAMWKYAFLVAITRTSEALTVGADGYVTFQRDGQAVEDLYEVVRIFDAANPKKPLIKRTSWEAPVGFWRDSANSKVHINGAGTYIMQYKGYPAKVTGAAQTLEWPSTSFDLLQYETIGKIKESLNDLEGAAAAYKIADGLVPVLAKASVDAYASGGYKPPGMNELQFFKRGG
jgi:hypothetical protein